MQKPDVMQQEGLVRLFMHIGVDSKFHRKKRKNIMVGC